MTATDAETTLDPEGWKLVPAQPTATMIDAMWAAVFEEGGAENVTIAYLAALAVAPSPPRSTLPREGQPWGSKPTPEEAAADLRQYAQNRRRLTGTCPPGDNIFEDAANVIDRLSALSPSPAVRDIPDGLYSDFTPITVGTSAPAVRDGVVDQGAVRRTIYSTLHLAFANKATTEQIDEAADFLTRDLVRALSTQEQGNG